MIWNNIQRTQWMYALIARIVYKLTKIEGKKVYVYGSIDNIAVNKHSIDYRNGNK